MRAHPRPSARARAVHRVADSRSTLPRAAVTARHARTRAHTDAVAALTSLWRLGRLAPCSAASTPARLNGARARDSREHRSPHCKATSYPGADGAAVLFGFSFVWPHVKLLLLHIFYYARLSPGVRRNALYWFAFFGKWSLADVLVMAVIIVRAAKPPLPAAAPCDRSALPWLARPASFLVVCLVLGRPIACRTGPSAHIAPLTAPLRPLASHPTSQGLFNLHLDMSYLEVSGHPPSSPRPPLPRSPPPLAPLPPHSPPPRAEWLGGRIGGALNGRSHRLLNRRTGVGAAQG